MIFFVIFSLSLVSVNSAGDAPEVDGLPGMDNCNIQEICQSVDVLARKPEYLGCFTDDNKRLLREKELKDDKMTHNMCIDHCQGKGYKFAGVENFKYCFCGNKLDMTKYRRVLETECNQPCQGDKTQFCGGGWRLGVFELK